MLTERVLDRARHQHGVFSRNQLLDLGASTSSIHRAGSDGRLVQLARGVYRVRSSPDTFEARCVAASLFSRGVGFVDGISAARLVGLRKMFTDIVTLTVPGAFRRSAPGWMRLHYTNWYWPDDRSMREDGIVVASPMRMLFTMAGRMNQHRFDKAADDAWQLGLVDPADALTFLERHRASGKNGVFRFERWVERALVQSAPSQSYLERDLIAEVERLGLASPVRQHPLVMRSGETIHLDCAWPDIRFAAEPGHSWFHRFDGGQERDHRRDAGCAELGWQVLRLDEKMLADMAGAARLVVRAHRRRSSDISPDPGFSSP